MSTEEENKTQPEAVLLTFKTAKKYLDIIKVVGTVLCGCPTYNNSEFRGFALPCVRMAGTCPFHRDKPNLKPLTADQLFMPQNSLVSAEREVVWERDPRPDRVDLMNALIKHVCVPIYASKTTAAPEPERKRAIPVAKNIIKYVAPSLMRELRNACVSPLYCGVERTGNISSGDLAFLNGFKLPCTMQKVPGKMFCGNHLRVRDAGAPRYHKLPVTDLLKPRSEYYEQFKFVWNPVPRDEELIEWYKGLVHMPTTPPSSSSSRKRKVEEVEEEEEEDDASSSSSSSSTLPQQKSTDEAEDAGVQVAKRQKISASSVQLPSSSLRHRLLDELVNRCDALEGQVARSHKLVADLYHQHQLHGDRLREFLKIADEGNQ